LRPLTDTTPKPLAPIANRALLVRTLTWLAGQGVTDVAINLHHCADKIRSAIGSGRECGLSVSYSVEDELLGTAGAVAKCASFFAGESFFVIYGDNLIEADLGPLMDFHKERDAAATIGLFVPDDPAASGMVEMAGDGRVTRFVEKPRAGETDAVMANAGVYVIDQSLLSALPGGFSDFGKDIFPAWLEDGRRVFGRDLGGYLRDTGTPDRYRTANWDLLAGVLRQRPNGAMMGEMLVGVNAQIGADVDTTRRNIVGADCRIGTRSLLCDCILLDGAGVGTDCVLTRVIVGEGAAVADGTVANDSILV
jgi:NDP-sugar pyrophosphorylase family protein